MIDLLLILFVKCLLWLRYRVGVRGVGRVLSKGRMGILFLPNHPALIDPIILLSRLYGPFRVRALADRDQVDRFLIRRLARRVNVLEIPDLATAGAATAPDVRRIVEECVEALRRGENLVLYPAGRAYRQYREDIGGNSAVETILHRLPDIRVVLVRTRGLWGSAFSRASGCEPAVDKVLWRGAKALLLSGLFLAPKRDVSIELVEPDDLPRAAGRAALNRYLENFYNAGAVGNTYVPYTIWEGGGPRQMREPVASRIQGDPGQVPPATRQIVRDYLQELMGATRFDDRSRLAHDLGMDSLARADLLLWLQSQFGFPPGDVESLQTVGDVMLAACGEAAPTAAKKLQGPPARWFSRPCPAHRPEDLAAMTIPQAFLAQARRDPDRAIIADQTSGAKTYRQLVLAIMLLKGQIEKLPGHRLGVMMPASVAADVLYLATLFAGKTPVMVNWTLGPRNLRHCLDAVGVKRVLTARAVAAQLRAQGVDLDEVADRLTFLEDIAGRLGLRAKLRAWLAARFTWAALDKARPPETAVVLFTSGSESLPKAVPLTHRNLLTNVSDAFECYTAEPADVILGILPPFHSFGVTALIVLPLCLGIRTAYYPNPNDGATLGRMIEAYKATMLIGTPTFLHGIVKASTNAQLATLRLVISGAEKCTPRVYDALAQHCPKTIVLEGYGVTECSPIISCNRQDDPRGGAIGRVLASLEYALADPQTNRRAQPAAPGVLLVRGPSVFGGYLHHEGPPPFVVFDGLPWYRTGDLVCEAADGVLTFVGRLKRFVKLGGEMISLPAIEAVLEAQYARDTDEGPILAVTALGEEDRPEIVLFTVKDLEREAVNAAIRQAGLSGLHNVRRVVRLDALPLLGTGKVDYRALAGIGPVETP